MCGCLGYETPLGGLGPRVENHCLRLWWVVLLYISVVDRVLATQFLSPGPLVATPWQALFLALLLVASALWDAFTWSLLVQRPLPGIAVEVDVR